MHFKLRKLENFQFSICLCSPAECAERLNKYVGASNASKWVCWMCKNVNMNSLQIIRKCSKFKVCRRFGCQITRKCSKDKVSAWAADPLSVVVGSTIVAYSFLSVFCVFSLCFIQSLRAFRRATVADWKLKVFEFAELEVHEVKYRCVNSLPVVELEV